MNYDEKRPESAGTQDQKQEANTAFTIEEDNEHRTLDKTEGRMNNGETGGAGNAEENENKPV